jgi:hypothetical protein
MGLTNFPYGVSSFGVPVMGSLPMIRGSWYFVNPDTTATDKDGQNPYPGSASNAGTYEAPFASIATAYDACVSGRGDGIVLLGGGTSTAECTTYLTAAITWSKHAITVYGVASPVMISGRARVSNSVANLACLIDLTGANNAFYNVTLYNSGTTGAGCLKITGGLRNFFWNCHIAGGMGMSTPTITDYDLYLSAAEYNMFVNCTIGDDSFDKTDIASAGLFFADNCGKNVFKNCIFLSYHSAVTAAPAAIKCVAGNGIIRSQFFDGCLFHLYDEGVMSTSVAAIIGVMPNNGLFIMKDSYICGFADWAAAANARVIVFASGTGHTDAQRGIAANAS